MAPILENGLALLLKVASRASASQAAPADDTAGEAINQRLTIGITVTCLCLSIITFCLRIHARLQSAAKLWWDDYWMFWVMVVCFGMSACDFVGMLQPQIGSLDTHDDPATDVIAQLDQVLRLVRANTRPLWSRPCCSNS